MMKRDTVLAVAVGLDLALGEPPDRLHPVVAMGHVIAILEGRAPGAERWRSAPPTAELAPGSRDDLPRRQLAYGAGMVVALLAVFAGAALALERYLARRRGWWAVPAAAVLLKSAFSWRALFAHIRAVEERLLAGDQAGAKRALMLVVSRDVAELSEEQICGAAIESLAENASDAVVAPVLYFALGGLPAAVAYRVVNTLDAMVGYRGRYEYLGKATARLDDALNFFPARLTALLLALASPLVGGEPRATWRAAARERRRTASPNAGWPMGAAAVALGVRLEKVGHYVLHPAGRGPVVADVGRARRLVAGALGLGLALAWLGLRRTRDGA